MKKIAILFLTFAFAAISLSAKVKNVDPEFQKFWNEYAGAYSKTDVSWLKDHINNLVYQGANGAGEPEIFTKSDYLSNMPVGEMSDKESAKLIKRMTDLKLTKALTISKVNQSFLDGDFGDGPIYTKLKIKGDDLLYSVLFDNVTYSFIKQGNTFKYLGIYDN